MARKVKVSTIGTVPPPAAGIAAEQLLPAMLDFWRGKLDRVLRDRPDLIVLPEYCDSFIDHAPSDSKAFARAHTAALQEFFSEVARTHHCYLLRPTYLPTDGDRFRNCAQLFNRDGALVGSYHKNFPTIGEIEELGMISGAETPVFECDFGRVICVTCFDLNFDALRERCAALKPDLVLYPSQCHGGLKQNFWAYSCRAHFVSAIAIQGMLSGMIAPTGQQLASTTYHYDHVTATLNLDCCMVHLDGNIPRLESLKQKYGPEVTITDPGLIAAVLITSESEQISVQEMVREFEIELLDDYLERAQCVICAPGNQETIHNL